METGHLSVDEQEDSANLSARNSCGKNRVIGVVELNQPVCFIVITFMRGGFGQGCRLELQKVGNKVENKANKEHAAYLRVDRSENEKVQGIAGSITHHVQSGAKPGTLVKFSRSHSVNNIE